MKNKLTRKKSGIIVICIWIFSSIAAAPALIYRKHFNRQWLDHVESWCTDEWPRIYNVKIMNDTKCISSIEEPLRKIYYTFISCVLFFIPIVFMSICYCLIIFKLSANHIPGENHLEKQLLFKRRKNVSIFFPFFHFILILNLLLFLRSRFYSSGYLFHLQFAGHQYKFCFFTKLTEIPIENQ